MHTTDLKDILRQPFCEYNLVVPLRLDGRTLTLLAADPAALEATHAPALLRVRYDVQVQAAPAEEVRAQIARVFAPSHRVFEPAPTPPPMAAPPASAIFAAPAAPAVDAVGKTCPFCQTPIKPGVPTRACPVCGMAHHEECWTANGGCTTFGCAGAATAPARAATAPAASPYASPLNRYAQPISPYAQEPPAYGRAYPTPPMVAWPERINDHLVESVLVTLMCCPPVGIASIGFSASARSRAAMGDIAGARAAASVANTLNVIAVLLMLFVFLSRCGV